MGESKLEMKTKRKNAVQSFGECKSRLLLPPEAVHSTCKEVQETGMKFLCYAQKNLKI